ncbi:MAG: hypothetical protein L6R36_007576 [Xanthoria steineri]|nr:MAG: hypothetical protein L6R36_007576 [Xanthoria steineri]
MRKTPNPMAQADLGPQSSETREPYLDCSPGPLPEQRYEVFTASLIRTVNARHLP